jgi:hypothetical protein
MQADTTQGLMSRDEQRYFNDTVGLQNQGLQSASHAFDVGYTASDTLANLLANNLAAEAGLQYQGTAFENSLEAQHASNMWNFGGNALGASMGIMGLGMGGNNNSYDYNEPYISGTSPHY